ncbi:Phosphinothricin N-acetyltransferase [Lactococcus lactis subsp. lactis]|uniref:Phosphinothricin N-acetyltransferase n=1 Tax=Lactococcus lactis subsp. lactis TaxID=1360 RepID=A0A0V8CYW0_LACLL|nr:Phosphinothricin N-acetyltransferase [Lactococcus lactis subsp. lactis]
MVWYGIVWLERSLQTTDKVSAIKLLTDLSENELEKILAN